MVSSNSSPPRLPETTPSSPFSSLDSVSSGPAIAAKARIARPSGSTDQAIGVGRSSSNGPSITAIRHPLTKARSTYFDKYKQPYQLDERLTPKSRSKKPKEASNAPPLPVDSSTPSSAASLRQSKANTSKESGPATPLTKSARSTEPPIASPNESQWASGQEASESSTSKTQTRLNAEVLAKAAAAGEGGPVLPRSASVEAWRRFAKDTNRKTDGQQRSPPEPQQVEASRQRARIIAAARFPPTGAGSGRIQSSVRVEEADPSADAATAQEADTPETSDDTVFKKPQPVTRSAKDPAPVTDKGLPQPSSIASSSKSIASAASSPTRSANSKPAVYGNTGLLRPVRPSAEPVPSIDDILRKYTLQPGKPVMAAPSLSTPLKQKELPVHSFPSLELGKQRRLSGKGMDESDSDNSQDSVAEELRRPPQTAKRLPAAPSVLKDLLSVSAMPVQRKTAFQALRDEQGPDSGPPRSSSSATDRPEPTRSKSDTFSVQSHRARTASLASPPSLPSSSTAEGTSDDANIAAFVQSPRLTRILTLSRPPHRGLRVSIADVGDFSGHPVVVFLGLGAVRYLIGLYDELAALHQLRLVCIDRWGMGKTDDVPADQRGVTQWSSVVSEVLDQLEIKRFSILAHSAGSPYALATASAHPQRVCGPIHLLAPWVGIDHESGYRWLRYVPGQILKTAQAAEWRLAGWRLGRAAEAQHSDAGSSEARSHSRATTVISPAPWEAQHISREDEVSSRTALPVALPSPVNSFSPGSGRSATPTKAKGNLFSLFTPKARSTPAPSPIGKGDFEGWLDGSSSPTVTSDISLRYRDGRSDSPAPPSSHARSESSASARSTQLSIRDIDFPLSLLKGGDGGSEQSIPFPPSPTAFRSRQGSSAMIKSLSHTAVSADQDLHGRRSSLGSASQQSSKESDRPSPVSKDSPTANLQLRTPRRKPSHHEMVDVASGKGSEATAQGRLHSADLATSLLRASHAESLRGSTADLMTILGSGAASSSSKKSTPSAGQQQFGTAYQQQWDGFRYEDITSPILIWYGDKDERIGWTGIRWMEENCIDCRVQVVKGAGHGLMTHTAVMIEALESLSSCRDER